MESKICLAVPRDRGCSMMRCVDEMEETFCVLVVFTPCDADILRAGKRMISHKFDDMISAVERGADGGDGSVDSSDALFRSVADLPPQRAGRVDVDGSLASALDGSGNGDHGTGLGRLHEVLLKARDILPFIKHHVDGIPETGAESDSLAHDSSPNCSARTPDMRDTTNFRRGPGGSPNAARRIPLFIVPGGE